MILIVTNKEDSHPSPVIDILYKNSASVFRLNTEALLTDYEFCWQNNAQTDFRIRNIHSGLTVKGSEIAAVWDRRPEAPSELFLQNTPKIDKHNLAEALGFLTFLRYYIKDIPSIGSIANDRIAASKMLQLEIANRIGFKTPNTCFSNRKKDVVDFFGPRKDLILKNIENDCIWDEENDQEYVFYAQKINSDMLPDIPEEAFSQTVSYVQNYIEKDYELRVTVVGNDVFACKIDSQVLDDDKGKIDWRQGYDHGLRHEIAHLPEKVEKQVVEFLRRLGLNFGCFDFIVTPEGEYVFLECNPNGQWLWVELETGMKISESIAKHLMNPVLLNHSFKLYG